MSRKAAKPVAEIEPIIDEDNPEWTEEDFARSVPMGGIRAGDLTPEILEQAFRAHRGPQKSPTKVAVSIRLSRDVLNHFKAGGPGWQSRIDQTLRKAAKIKAS